MGPFWIFAAATAYVVRWKVLWCAVHHSGVGVWGPLANDDSTPGASVDEHQEHGQEIVSTHDVAYAAARRWSVH